MPDGGASVAIANVVMGAFSAVGASTGVTAAAGAATLSTVGFLATYGSTVALVTSVALGALSQQKKKPELSMSPTDRTQTIQSTQAPREYVYGRTKKGGPLLFHYCTQDNQTFYYVLALASHQIQEIEKIHINEDEDLTLGTELIVDDSYTSTGITHYKASYHANLNPANKYAGTGGLDTTANRYLWVDVSLGSDSVGVNNRFKNEITADGGDYVSTDKFSGIACLFIKIRWGAGLWRGLPKISATIKGKNDIYDTRTSTSGYSTNPALIWRDILLDDVIGINAESDEIDETALNTAANVCDESVALNGGGTEDRYTCNGVVDSTSRRVDLIENVLSCMAGSQVYVNGLFKVIAGAYQTPTVEITDADIISGIGLTRLGARDKFNAVKGVFINEDENWQPTEFPHVTNSTYETEDGEVRYRDLELPFTISSPTAQRLALIDLERNRQDISVTVLLHLKKYDFAPGDTIKFTYADWGFSEKVFDVIERSLVTTTDANGNPMLAIQVTMRETASTVYTWNNDETVIDPAPNTNLPNPFAVVAPTNLQLDSTEEHLIRGANGRIVTRIKATWTEPSNHFVTSGGNYEVQYKKSTDATYSPSIVVPGDLTEAFITDVDDRVQYDIRVRAVNAFTARSDWLTSTNHTVIGKTTPPPNVTGFAAAEELGIVKLSWDQLDIVDIYGYEVRYGSDGIQWKNAIPLTTAKQGTSETTAQVPPGTWSFLIKGVDYVGNYSSSAAVYGPLFVSNANSVLNAIDDGEFPGTLENFVLHYTGVLVPDSQNLASDDDWDTFDTAVINPYQECIYTSEQIDLGSDKDVRVWGVIESELLPGVTEGVANPTMQIAYWSSTDESPGSDQTDDLIPTATLTNCILHYTGAIVPDSDSLASDADWEIFDQFVYDAKETCTVESAEVDYGSDGNIALSMTQDILPGPGETGTPEATTYIDTRTSSGSYDGYSTFTAGTFNLRYAKIKVEWNNNTTVSYINQLQLVADPWRDWINGNINGVRYVKARIKLDTTVGVAKVTSFNWTIDQ